VTSLLGSWRELQRQGRERLREASEDTVRLLEAACLVEVAKVGAGTPDLSTYVRLAAEAVVDFLAARRCTIEVNLPDLPSLCVIVGDQAVGPPDQPEHTVCVALGEGPRPMGQLVVERFPVVVPADSVTRVAEQLAAGLAGIVETERLRRQASAMEAFRAITGLTAGYSDGTLERFAAELAVVGPAVGARLWLDLPSLAQPLEVRTGLAEAAATFGADVAVEPSGRVGVTVYCAAEPVDDERRLFHDLATALGAAVSSVERECRLLSETETDALTGIGNRRRLASALASGLAQAERRCESLAVIEVDLDHFKIVNDRLGHDAGDTVLRTVAEALRGLVRPYDTVVRVGGDEFVVVCPGTDAVSAAGLAERFRVGIPEACRTVLEGWAQTASVGWAIFPLDREAGPQLLEQADRALYAAKRAGRDRVMAARDAV